MRRVGVAAVLVAVAVAAGGCAAQPKIKAFCVDFNWGPGGPNAFAGPGVYAQADPKTHIEWYKRLGVNVVQTFCVSCNGFAWYKDSAVAPVQPDLKHDFLSEITELAHAEGMKVMGYFCVGANTWWAQKHPQENYGAPSMTHIPFTHKYIDYLCASIRDALTKTDIDGFMLDWFFHGPYTPPDAPVKWLYCEQEMWVELMGSPFPGYEKITPQQHVEFKRRSIERCWKWIYRTAKEVKPDCVIWLSCHDLKHPQVQGTRLLREVDWLMNEHPDPAYLDNARAAAGRDTTIVQCLCGWGPKHDPAEIVKDPRFAGVGYYGFAMPDPGTTLPPTLEAAGDDKKLSGNARSIEVLRRIFTEQ